MDQDDSLELASPSRPGAALTPWIQLRDITLVAGFMGWLIWWLVPDSHLVERYIPIGTVQQIRYFGALSIHTQVDTVDAQGVERNLAVDIATSFHKGQEVVLHVRQYHTELCSADRAVCESLWGDPQ